MKSTQGKQYKEIMPNDEHLAVFLRAMARFDCEFCRFMSEGIDFTLQLEIRADVGKMVHSRIHSNVFDRPKDSPKRKDYGG